MSEQTNESHLTDHQNTQPPTTAARQPLQKIDASYDTPDLTKMTLRRAIRKSGLHEKRLGGEVFSLNGGPDRGSPPLCST
jgi:hypothetical protein